MQTLPYNEYEYMRWEMKMGLSCIGLAEVVGFAEVLEKKGVKRLPCKLCGSTERGIGANDQIVEVRCLNCGFVQTFRKDLLLGGVD